MTSKKSKEIQLIEQAAREFARRELAPSREENDHYPFGPFWERTVARAFEIGFFHLTLPSELGGIGHGIQELCLVLTTLCQADSSLGGIIFTHALAQEILLAAGEGEHLRRRADGAGKADDFLLAFPALDHPGEHPLTLAARREGDACILTGSSPCVVLGNLAGHALLPARLGDAPGFSFFLIDLDHPGIVKSDPVLCHGLRACPVVDLTLGEVPGEPIGEDGWGEEYFRRIFPSMQLAAAAMACGIMKGSLDEAVAYCRERRQGGLRIKDWSLLRMKLADMSIQVQVAQMLIANASRAIAGKEKGWREMAPAAALHIMAAAGELVTEGIQAMGGVGYMKDFGQEKRFRDAGQVQALLGLYPMKKLRLADEFLGREELKPFFTTKEYSCATFM